jgi:hypothetical protein
MPTSIASHVLETVWKIGRARDRDTLVGGMRGLDSAGASTLRWSVWVAMLWLASGVGACSVEEAGAGQGCLRSAECAPGLVCIEGVCSDDLSSIADPGEVPTLTPEEQDTELEPDVGEVTVDAAMMMMTTTEDAAMMPLADAAMPAEGGSAP